SVSVCLFVSGCTEKTFVTQTVAVGQNVTLTCARHKSIHSETLHWIRLVSGNFPEFLGGTFTFDFDSVNTTPRITAKQEPGTFLLHISEPKPSDSGLYYCIKVKQFDMLFLTGIFLRIRGPEPEITSALHVASSDPVRPGDSVTLQCSVLSDSESDTCPRDHSVYWFRAGSDESHPNIIYTDGNNECEKRSDTVKSCVYHF
uniref:Ig-like domain-containing protein n=1 Tax=Mastacembelus armatus TaxID=205130 RepID=A0A3Q3MIJ0_9TELE